MKLVLASLALVGLTLGVVVATKGRPSAERAIERRERQMFKHFARLEAASRARRAH
tara:strand:+ start:367 stop:534 length:168 start_codon:yes stop_codon:yes gene_type:complete